MSNDWKLTKKIRIHDYFYKSLEEWTFKTHANKEKTYIIDVEPDTVVVFGITRDDKVLTLREYFLAPQKRVLSLVAGIVDKEKSLVEIAVEELREETGCVASEMVYLGHLIKGKYTAGLVHLFLAKNVERKYEQQLEDSEDIEVNFMGLEQFKEALRQGGLSPLHEFAVAYRALDYLGKL